MYHERKVEMSLAEFQRKVKQNFSDNRRYMVDFNERELKFVMDKNRNELKIFFKPTFSERANLASEFYCIFDASKDDSNKISLNYLVRKPIRSYIYYVVECVIIWVILLFFIKQSGANVHIGITPITFVVAIMFNLYFRRKCNSRLDERLVEIFEEFLDGVNS